MNRMKKKRGLLEDREGIVGHVTDSRDICYSVSSVSATAKASNTLLSGIEDKA